jgi:hypothetical protein
VPAAQSGGSAGAGGFDFQDRVATWFGVAVLAGPAAAPIQSLWSGTLSRVDCETEDCVDDVRVRPTSGPTLAIQVKRTLTLSDALNSELAKTIRQFVTHHRSPSHDSDLLVLIVGPDASGSVRNDVARFLARVYHADPSTLVASIALTSNGQTRARSVLSSLISSAWSQETGSEPTEAELRGLLAVVRVVVLNVEPDGVDERQARELLRAQVVATTDTADAAWSSLLVHFSRLAAEHGGADQAQLQTVLAQANIRLRAPLDYRADVKRLEALTTATLAGQPSLLTIPTAAGPITLPRAAIDLVAQRAQEASLLVIGQAGAGKSAALARLTERLLAGDTPVLAVAVGSTAASSLGELRNELGLDHDLFEVFKEWLPGQGGVLVLDALDAARTEPQADFWRSIIERASAELDGWRVVASVRTWDLRHSAPLRTLFPADPTRIASSGYVDEEFHNVEHVHIPILDDSELSALRASSPEINGLLDGAPAEVTDLLRNLFNLRLAAELLLAGAGIGELHQLQSQLQLLERYWAYRVTDGSGGLAREEILRRACDHALNKHTLSIPRPVLLTGDISGAAPLEELLSRHVLEETATPAGGPPPQTLRFAHHILFDYAVASTVLAGLDDPSLLARLRDDPAVALFARPSIDMRLERLWNSDRQRFWGIALQASGEDPRPGLVCVIFAEVAARRVQQIDDLAMLLEAAAQPSPPAGTIRLWRDLVVAVGLDRQNDPQAPLGIWPQVAARLSAHVAATEYPLRILLDDLVRTGMPMAGDDLDQCDIAARNLLGHAWIQARTPAVRLTIEAVVATAASDPTATETLLRQAISPTQLAACGYQDLHWIAKAVPDLATLMPGFVEDLYVAVFPHEETSREPTQLVPSAILGLRSNRHQDFESVKFELVEQFPAFLAIAPSHTLSVLDRLVAAAHDLQPDATVTLQSSSRTLSVIPDDSGWWDDRSYANQHDLAILLEKFETHLAEAARSDPPRLASMLDLLAGKPRPAVLWRRVILAAASEPTAATDLMPLCWTQTALTIDDFEEPLALLIEDMAPRLGSAERAHIEATVVALHPGPDDGSDAWRQQDLRFRRFFHALGSHPPPSTLQPRLRATRPCHPSLAHSQLSPPHVADQMKAPSGMASASTMTPTAPHGPSSKYSTNSATSTSTTLHRPTASPAVSPLLTSSPVSAKPFPRKSRSGPKARWPAPPNAGAAPATSQKRFSATPARCSSSSATSHCRNPAPPTRTAAAGSRLSPKDPRGCRPRSPTAGQPTGTCRHRAAQRCRRIRSRRCALGAVLNRSWPRPSPPHRTRAHVAAATPDR